MATQLGSATLLNNIKSANPAVPVNANFINAVYQYAYGRNATANELKRFAGQTVASVANTIIGKNSPFISTPGASLVNNPVASTPPNTSTTTQPTQDTGSTKDIYGNVIGGTGRDPNATLSDLIRQFYQSKLGRDAGEEEVKQWTDWAGGRGIDAIESEISKTPEYARYDAYSKLSPEYKLIVDESQKLLDELAKQGNTVNPNIEITPEKAAEFMQKAESEINPYYAGQLKLAKEDFLTSVGYDRDSILRLEQGYADQYKKGFKQIGETAADTGFALSGRRIGQETDIDTATNRQIQENRIGLQGRAGELMRTFQRQYAGLPGFEAQTATIEKAPTVGGGAFNTSTESTPLYNLDPSIYDKLIGEQEYLRRAATKTRQSELESAFREANSINTQRSLTL